MRRLVLAAGFAAAVTPAFAGPYLFELMEIKAYRAGFTEMLKGEKKLPAWLVDFNKSLNGVSTPSEDLEIDGQSYTYAWVCKPHDCGGNELHIVFDIEGHAFGLLKGSADGDTPKDRFFGKPDKAVADALAARAGT
jgi:hypothetical protein